MKLRVKLICNQLFKKEYILYGKGVWKEKEPGRWSLFSITGRDQGPISFSYPNFLRLSYALDFSGGITTPSYNFLKKAYVHFDSSIDDVFVGELTWLFFDFGEIEFSDDPKSAGNRDTLSLLRKEAEKFDQWLCEAHGKPEQIRWAAGTYKVDEPPAFRVYLFECNESPGNWLFSLPEKEAIEYLRRLRKILGMDTLVTQPTIFGAVICDASPEKPPYRASFPWGGISMFTPNLRSEQDEEFKEFCHLPIALISMKDLWVAYTALSKVERKLDELPFLRTYGYKDIFPFQIKDLRDLMKRGGRKISSLYAEYLARQLNLDENLIMLDQNFQRYKQKMSREIEIVFLPGAQGVYNLREGHPYRRNLATEVRNAMAGICHRISGKLELANTRRKLFSEAVGNYFDAISAKNNYKTATSVKRYTLIIFFLTLVNVLILVTVYWNEFYPVIFNLFKDFF